MSFPIKINDQPIAPDIFNNQKWKETDHYFLCTKSEFFCRANLVAIDKQVTEIANEAIVYLLQRYVKETEGWNEQMLTDLSPEQFASFIFSHVLSDNGIDLSIEEAWKNYSAIIYGMRKEKVLTITKNGIPTEELDLEFLEKHYLLSVTSFANCWNNMEYLFETWTGWILFSWGTGA